MSSDLTSQADQALRQWQSATSEQERAIAEEKIWTDASKEDRKAYDRRSYLSLLLSVSKHALQNRRIILHAPQFLWALVDGDEKMPVISAARLWMKARRRAEKKGSQAAEEITFIVEAYKRSSYRMTPQGRVKRQKAADKLQNPEKRHDFGPKKWVSRLRQDVANLVGEAGKDLSEFERSNLYSWLDAEIKLVVANFRERALRLSRQAQEPPPSRKAVVAACRTLSLDPPIPGQAPDMIAARRAKRSMARAYHPDLVGDDENLRALYEEAIKAYEVLEDFVNRGNIEVERKEGDNVESNVQGT